MATTKTMVLTNIKTGNDIEGWKFLVFVLKKRRVWWLFRSCHLNRDRNCCSLMMLYYDVRRQLLGHSTVFRCCCIVYVSAGVCVMLVDVTRCVGWLAQITLIYFNDVTTSRRGFGCQCNVIYNWKIFHEYFDGEFRRQFQDDTFEGHSNDGF